MAIDKYDDTLLVFAYITKAVTTEIIEKNKLPKEAILVDLVEIYLKVLRTDDNPAILTVAQNSHTICLIILTINKKNQDRINYE